MKKFCFVLLALLLTLSCSSSKKGEIVATEKVDFSTEVEGEVYKIDSLKQFHLIYVSNEKQSYKIISKKTSRVDCKEVQVGSTYKLGLVSLLGEVSTSEGNSDIPTPINHLDIARCKKYEDGTEICTEPGINNLYSTSNLEGLCLVNIIK